MDRPQQIIEFEASTITVKVESDGTAVLWMATDKGQVLVGLRRDVLERLDIQIKHELAHVKRPTRPL